jgi:VanZ family protein
MLLAVSIEFAQIFFPPRTVSQNDLIAEGIGTILGAVIWVRFGRRLAGLWRQFLQGGPTARRAFVLLYLIAYLAISLFPYDFLLSRGELADKLASPGAWAPLIAGSCGDSLHCSVKLLAEVLVVAPLGFLLGMATPARTSVGLAGAFGWGALLGLAIEALQLFVASGITQGVSILTRGVAAAWGLAVFRYLRWEWVQRHRSQLRTLALLGLPLYVALLLALNGILSKAWQPLWLARERLDSVHFLPFYYHYFTTETEALFSALAAAGAYAPFGLAAWLLVSSRKTSSGRGLAVLLGGLTALVVETLKLFVPGERPDPTNVLIGAAAAWLTCAVLNHVSRVSSGEQRHVRAQTAKPSPSRTGAWRYAAAASVAVLLVSGLTGWLVASPEREPYVDESKLPQLPPPDELPLARLPNFHYTHPRLPHPSQLDIERLRRENPGFIRGQDKRARSGAGDVESVALMELVKPGSQNLDLLHRRLMDLKFDWRGHQQVKPLAVAYDWLYPNWTPDQREQLADKLAQGCDYQIELIRKDRLSPYNVYLYNSPFQALMACAIALYGEHRRGEAVMAFTYDYWKNRVLPVWRQVMGRNGGWHEGREYVGIGIGQAIYQLPAMWREATGEDLFRSEPGIRGFLDFLVYRTQPDGTHFRWGDGSAFERQVPDAISLAIEYGHRAAYALNRPPRDPTPTAWPWGPLSDSHLADPRAVEGLPLVAHFDGLGMIVARSDWSPEATYVTFKAGDNYWSHSHLDQGAFTIYKGADWRSTGHCGPYGSDHHMNYSYQTVAHNVVTVTDPEDRVPAREKINRAPLRTTADSAGSAQAGVLKQRRSTWPSGRQSARSTTLVGSSACSTKTVWSSLSPT